MSDRNVPLALAATGLAIMVVLALLGRLASPAYVAAWLFWLSVPVGALALVMSLDLASQGLRPMAVAARGLLVGMPVVALLALPVLLQTSLFTHWPAAISPLARFWTQPLFFIMRICVYLVAWNALAFLFIRLPDANATQRPPGTIAACVCLHIVVSTLAAADLLLSLAPGFGSAVLPVIVMSFQAGVAICVTLLVLSSANSDDAALSAKLALLALGIAIALQFVQYLTAWSANLPSEAAWYARRLNGPGLVWIAAAFAVYLAAHFILPQRHWPAWRTLSLGCAAAMLVVYAGEIFWLVTPSLRPSFEIGAFDLLALAAVGAIVCAACWSKMAAARKGRPHHA